MSNFTSLGLVNAGLPGTAPQIFIASTPDSSDDITAAGYLNDINHKIKANDLFYINYADTSTFPLNVGEASTFGGFNVVYSSPNWSLVAVPVSGVGQAAAKAVTDNTKPSVASVDGSAASYTVGNFLVAGDTNGTIGADSGLNVANVLRQASVNLTAAQFLGMSAAPVQLIAAPGAGNMVIVDRMEIIMTYDSVAYATGGAVLAQYGNAALGAGPAAVNSEAAADFFAVASTVFAFNGISGNTVGALPFSSCANAGVFLSNATAPFTLGNSTFTVVIHYRIIAV